MRKLPEPRISILSPDRSAQITESKIVSTITSLSRRVRSHSLVTSSTRSAFVMVKVAPVFLAPANYTRCNLFAVHAGGELWRPIPFLPEPRGCAEGALPPEEIKPGVLLQQPARIRKQIACIRREKIPQPVMRGSRFVGSSHVGCRRSVSESGPAAGEAR